MCSVPQRRSDGTISLEGVRFEIPNRLRHLSSLMVRYARWNLGCVHVVDSRTDTLIAPIHPLDKVRNADGQRRVLEPVLPATAPPATSAGDMAPLLRKLMTEYAATGIPPAYLPLTRDGCSASKSDEVASRVQGLPPPHHEERV